MNNPNCILFADADADALETVARRFATIFHDAFRYEKAVNALEAQEVVMNEIMLRGALPAMFVCEWTTPGDKYPQLAKDLAKGYPEVPMLVFSNETDEEFEKLARRAQAPMLLLDKPWNGSEKIEKISLALAC